MAAHDGRLNPAGSGASGLLAEPAVRVEDLVRRFGERTVLDHVHLSIAPGEFVALLGQSGSGKSTMLRALAGLDEVDGRANAGWSGKVDVPEKRSVIFQDSRLLPWERVLGNVVLGLSGSAAADRGRASLAEVGLSDRERAWPNELSGGERQRVALARSLVREPELLLADEPFGALDALTRVRMHALLRRLCEVHRPAVLLVTHDVDEAITLADRVLVLTDGRIGLHLEIDPVDARRPDSPAYGALRTELLTELGVVGDKVADADDNGSDGNNHTLTTSGGWQK